jgi:hypothetical protein
MEKMIVALAVLLLTACGASGPRTYGDNASGFVNIMPRTQAKIMYEGEVKKFEEVGVVVLDSILTAQSFQNTATQSQLKPIKEFKTGGLVASVDRQQYHFLPGNYNIEFCFSISNGQYSAWCRSNLPQAFEIKAGQIIQFSYLDSGRSRWSIVSSDGAKDKSVIEKDFEALLKSPVKP